MAKLEISVENGQGEALCRVDGENEIWLVHQGEYVPGDKLVFSTDEVPGYYVIRVDGAMDEAFVYLTCQSVEYAIPFEPDNPIQADRISYGPGCFIGERHYITLRRARAEETKNYRNLAKNVMDQRDMVGCYPHVHANAATQGPAAPLFAARNVIDGVLANDRHAPCFSNPAPNSCMAKAGRVDSGRRPIPLPCIDAD